MSNQVYRDKQGLIPYDGEQKLYSITLTGQAGTPTPGTGVLSVQFSRMNPTVVALHIVSTTAGVVWGASNNALISAVGAIPLGFRPISFNAVWIVCVAGGLNINCLFNANPNGQISITYPTPPTGGPLIEFPTGSVVFPQTIIWNTA